MGGGGCPCRGRNVCCGTEPAGMGPRLCGFPGVWLLGMCEHLLQSLHFYMRVLFPPEELALSQPAPCKGTVTGCHFPAC